MSWGRIVSFRMGQRGTVRLSSRASFDPQLPACARLEHTIGRVLRPVRSGVPSGLMWSGFIEIVEDVMRLQLHCHSDIDLSQPGVQVDIRAGLQPASAKHG